MLNQPNDNYLTHAKGRIDNLRGIQRAQWPAPVSYGGVIEYGTPGASARDYVYEKLGYGAVNAVNRTRSQWNQEHPNTAVISRKVRPWDISPVFAAVIVVVTLAVAIGGYPKEALVVGIGFFAFLMLMMNLPLGIGGRRQYKMVAADDRGVPLESRRGWTIETPIADNGVDVSNAPAQIAAYGLESWQKGADGETIAAELMRSVLDNRYVVFHDVKVPASNANADHILLGQRMAFNVDSKNWNGRTIGLDGGRITGVHGDPFSAIYFEKNAILSVAGVPGAFPTASVIVVTGDAPVEGGIIEVKGVNDLGDPEMSYITDRSNFARLVEHLDEHAPESAYHRDSVAMALAAQTEPA